MTPTVDLALFNMANALAGRSFTLDALIALALSSSVVKGGPIAACFLFAWWHGAPAPQRGAKRATLLLTLLALFVIAPVMKVVSTAMPISPRPLVAAENVLVLTDGKMIAHGPIGYRAPVTGLAAELASKAEAGTVAQNDLFSFPSDHAALFAAFAGGIFFAMRSAGVVAIAWALLGIFLPRVATGLHWPSDMAAGAIAGLTMLGFVLFAGRTVLRPPLGRLLALTERHQGWGQALILLALFEAASGMETLRRLAELTLTVFGR